jgi:hypothetical protein
VGSLVPSPGCAVQRGQKVLHMRILEYSMLRTIINDRLGDLVMLVKNRHTQLMFYIAFWSIIIPSRNDR